MLKKKEKLEQMRELGRGGLSKGLHFLRTAKTNASLDNGEASSSLSHTEEGGISTSRMTYEELLALSMKLTRQNKLMKLQYQKNQSKVAAANRYEADVQALQGFLEVELGLDVAACVRTDSTLEGSIDVDALKMKYRASANAQYEDENKVQAPVESVNLLHLSPVPVKTYEEIDLLAGDHQNVPYEDAQMDEAMQQVDRMREQLRQSAQQTQELEQKLKERNEQQEQVTRDLVDEKQRLEEKEREWKFKWEEQIADNCEKTQRLEEFERRMQDMSLEMEASLKQREEEQKQAAVALATVEHEKMELAKCLHQEAATVSMEQERQEMKSFEVDVNLQGLDLEAAKAHNAHLEGQLEAMQPSPTALDDQVNEVIKVEETNHEADSTRLDSHVQALPTDLSTITKAEVEAIMAAALEEQQSELDAAKAENGRLLDKIEALQQTVVDSMAELLDERPEEEVEAAIEAVKAEHCRLHDQLENMQQTAAIVSSEAKMEATEGAVTDLRAEMDRLQGLLAVKNTSCEALQAEVVSLQNRVKVPEDASQKIMKQDEDLSLIQDLERVKFESADLAHENQSLQKKLCDAEDSLLQAITEREAAQALVEELKEDLSRLAKEKAECKEKEIASENKVAALTDSKLELEKEHERAHEAKAALEKQMEEERAYWTSKLENLITASDAAKSKMETLETELEEKKKQIVRMSTSQTSMTSELMELQKQVPNLRKDLAMAADSLEAHATKVEEYERRYFESEKEVAKLKTQLDEMRDKHHENFEMLRKEKEGELERVHAERRTLMTAKTELCQEKEKLQGRCKTLERKLETAHEHEEGLGLSLREMTLQVDNLSLDLAETKKSLSDRMALATRLQTENMSMAGKLAEQVALIESALRDAANSKIAQQEMETQVQAAKAEMERIKKSESAVKQDLENVQREVLEQEANFQREREKAQLALQAAVENEKHTFRRELDRVEAESKHKSKLALQAVLKKEKEIARLSARLTEVEEDVRSGGADNRKILELAQLQAKREAEQREQAAQMQTLSQQLEIAQREIQEFREDKQRLAEELKAMLQNQRRDGVNMEYLKNVVVQYMSFRPGTSEQARLVPVLTTLLQFTAADIKEIKRAARRGNSWTSWGSSDTELDYKPIVVGAKHRHTMTPPSSTAQDNGEQSKGLAPVSRLAPPAEDLLKLSRASSFVLLEGEPVDSSAASADF